VAFGVERRVAAPLLLSAGTCCTVRMLHALAGHSAAHPRMMGLTDRQTDARPLHRPFSAYYAGSANNGY